MVQRCRWCNENNPLYVEYHDHEWGVINKDDRYLFEMLVLESFQAGLSWECVLNKRAAFKQAFAAFDWLKVAAFDNDKINELLNDKGIIRNRLKIKAAVNNARVFAAICQEYGSFFNYLSQICGEEIIYENDKSSSPLSDKLSQDLRQRGMKFVGSTIIYAYLQAIGIIDSHENECFKYHDNGEKQNDKSNQ